MPDAFARDPQYRGYRFPAEIISHAVWLYYRFHLSHRVGDDLLAIASERSAALRAAGATPNDLATWLRALPAAEKDDLLLELAHHGAA